MIGEIYSQLSDYIIDNLGMAAWNQALDELDLDSKGVYSTGATYGDDEALAIVAWCSSHLGQPVPDILRNFGAHLFHKLKTKQAAKGIKSEDFFTFLSNVESVTHKMVRQMSAKSTPPILTVERQQNRVTIHYESARKLCFLAEGLVMGCADHYGVSIQVSQSCCMHNGDDYCLICVVTNE